MFQQSNNPKVKTKVPKSADSGMLNNSTSQTKDNLWGNQPTSKIYNAKGIVENALQGINRVVKLLVVIEGEVIKHFKHFKLTQSAVKHHEFSLVLPHDAMGEEESYQLEIGQKFLGKRLTVVFRYKDVLDGPERTFVGVITEVGFGQDKGSLGDIIIKGFSPTILLDASEHTQSFGGTQPISLNSIADSVIQQGINKSFYDYRIASKYGNLDYSAQYEETHYNYLARMAEAYGEQFFYDGEVLHFGQLPPAEQPITLQYGSNINDIRVRMRAQHVQPSFYGYNSSSDTKLTTGSSSISHKSDIAKRAYDISQKTFTTPALRLAPIKARTDMDIGASQNSTAGSKAVDVFVTSGSTTVPFLHPGCIADVEMRKPGKVTTNYFTKLMITEVTHEVDARGYYEGHFEAIAADTGFMPTPKFQLPRSEVQVAKVTANADPKNQGRVQVQFDWQSGSDTTDWIRVMTPDAGGSDKVSKNRGFMAIPEIGDQVMVGFQHQLPDRPFVMGSMFHGKVGGGGGAGNNVKSLSGKSGNIICLNDGAGIEIKDKAGNHVTLSGTGNLTTEISNNYTETFGNDSYSTVKNNSIVNVTTKSTHDVGAGQSVLTMGSDGIIDLTGAMKLTLKVGGSTIEITDTAITLKSATINVEGSTKTNVGKTGGNPGMVVDGNVTITGGKVDIN